MEDEKYCNHLEITPSDKPRMEPYLCKITEQPCIGQIDDEISLQPSHYCPEDVFYYNDSDARRRCPAYGVTDDLLKKILEFRNALDDI